MIYELSFTDRQVKEYGANIIARNMLTQVDSDSFSLALMVGIINHTKDGAIAVPMEDKYLITQSIPQQVRKTTVGWKLLVKWRDQSESLIKLADMKERHPVETAEYAKARGIHNEPAFYWWVLITLKKRDAIIAVANSRVYKTTHKYRIEIPTSVEHARELDRNNKNTLWMDTLAKEMYDVGIAFEDGRTPGVGCKMDFTWKAWCVLDRHQTPDPIGSTFAGVVSHESV